MRIGEKTITENEFIYRAEYTPRPAYCRGSTNIHKKIVLNSLIAEKLLALEAGEDNEFIQSKNVQAYIKGRREQAMREILYTKDAYETVILDTTQILETLNLSGRTYSNTYDYFKDYPFVIFVGSRGCPFKCSFCEVPSIASLYTAQKSTIYQNVDAFIDEIEDVKKEGLL